MGVWSGTWTTYKPTSRGLPSLTPKSGCRETSRKTLPPRLIHDSCTRLTCEDKNMLLLIKEGVERRYQYTKTLSSTGDVVSCIRDSLE